MALRAFTDDPRKLLEAFRSGIEDGKISIWRTDKDGDFTLVSQQWGGRAWMRPVVLDDRLLFNIIGSKKEPMSKTIYGVYHGRLAQSLLIHFDKLMSTVSATALGTSGDNI
jgi:hypothetical protein